MSRRHLSRIGDCRKSVDTDVGALDPLTAPSLSALKAVWWTRQLRQAFTDPVYDATHFYDQSGHSKDLLSGASIGTAAEGHDTALVLASGVPNTLTRGDAVGLPTSANPALTLVWKMRITDDLGNTDAVVQQLLGLGSAAGAEELNMFFHRSSTFDVVEITNADASLGQNWILPFGALSGWHNYVLVMQAGFGYKAETQKLYVDGIAQPRGSSPEGNLTLGSASTFVGDFDGGGFPFGGHLAGMLVFNAALSGADLALVQAL